MKLGFGFLSGGMIGPVQARASALGSALKPACVERGRERADTGLKAKGNVSRAFGDISAGHRSHLH